MLHQQKTMFHRIPTIGKNVLHCTTVAEIIWYQQKYRYTALLLCIGIIVTGSRTRVAWQFFSGVNLQVRVTPSRALMFISFKTMSVTPATEHTAGRSYETISTHEIMRSLTPENVTAAGNTSAALLIVSSST